MSVLYDSSIYIAALRIGDEANVLLERWAGDTPLWLSAVVLEELYVGARNESLRLVTGLERDFEGSKRILTPNTSDWIQAGKILARLARKYGYEEIGRARMTNDALIAASAARTGVTIITTNGSDFSRLAEFCALEWQTGMYS